METNRLSMRAREESHVQYILHIKWQGTTFTVCCGMEVERWNRFRIRWFAFMIFVKPSVLSSQFLLKQSVCRCFPCLEKEFPYKMYCGNCFHVKREGGRRRIKMTRVVDTTIWRDIVDTDKNYWKKRDTYQFPFPFPSSSSANSAKTMSDIGIDKNRSNKNVQWNLMR